MEPNKKGEWRLWYSTILRGLGLLTIVVAMHYVPKPWGLFGVLIGIYVFMVGLINKRKYEQSKREN